MKNKFFLIIIFLLIFTIGVWFGKALVVCEICPPEDVNFSLFWESWNALKSEYANPEDMDTQKMIYGAISGMVKSLEDPYTAFFNPEDAKRFLEDVNGKFEGADNETFVFLGNYYAKDKNNAYYMKKIINGIDLNTFETYENSNCAKDKNHRYKNGKIIVPGDEGYERCEEKEKNFFDKIIDDIF